MSGGADADDAAGAATVHATALVVGEAGLLLRGPSGAGKSCLALDIAFRAGPHSFVRLVADDRVQLSARNGRLLARPPDMLAGLVEERNVGVVRVPFERACVVRVVVDLGAAAERVPQATETVAEIIGVEVTRLALPAGVDGSTAARIVLDRLSRGF